MPNETLTKLKKYRTIPFIKDDEGEFLRIGKSTIFALSLNANVVTQDFIEDEAPTDEVSYYKPTLPQELAAYKGDPAFDFIYDMFYNLPTGTGVQKTLLIVFDGNIGTEAALKFNAWQANVTVVLKDFNTVDEKITFDLNFNGNIERGTATITDGTPSFTTAATA